MPKNASEKNHPHVRSNPKEKDAIIQKHQQLTWNYLPTIASRESRKRSGEVSVRKNRPVDLALRSMSELAAGCDLSQCQLVSGWRKCQ
ncbi:hypothetical protein P692DRAFT_20836373 [Suillus brevipes Sb2]|nr:hypothetical protein P692DRAFT_20836373 [Suillus brevipes Sb2]